MNAEGKIDRTSPVGVYPNDSPCGARDMAGNVWEWCQTAWREYPYQLDAREQLTGNQRQLLRGGAWYFRLHDVACAFRNVVGPVHRLNNVGFRCARTLVHFSLLPFTLLLLFTASKIFKKIGAPVFDVKFFSALGVTFPPLQRLH